MLEEHKQEQELAEMGAQSAGSCYAPGQRENISGVWRAKEGINFHRNIYKYSGLGRHYFEDSSSP